MTFTVIIPFYNQIDPLLTTLKSISLQSIQPDEIILSDDGSNLAISGIFEYAQTMKPAILYVKQERKGFRAARCRNNAIRQVNTDYVIFNDQDIVGTEHYYRTFINNAREGEFLVAYPTRMTEAETIDLRKQIDNCIPITGTTFHTRQYYKIARQYHKEKLYYFLKKMRIDRGFHPKLRSGVFGIYFNDLLHVDGFDESYQNWGYEDDDLGRRLYASGMLGKNAFKNDYPFHQYHPTLATTDRNSNRDYYIKRKGEISKNDYRAVIGVSNSDGQEDLIIKRIKNKTV